MKPKLRLPVLCFVVLSAAWAAHGQSAADAGRLGKELTPVGAERAANRDGSIPEWTGGQRQAPRGFVQGGPRVDPFGADKPAYVIDSGNVQKYEDRLSPGQVALIKSTPGYRMDVYPTRRSCAYNNEWYERTRANVGKAKLNKGNLVDGVPGGVPFPIPVTGEQAIWNHLARWRPTYYTGEFAIYAPSRSGDFTPLVQQYEGYYSWGDHQNKTIEALNNELINLFVTVAAPARSAGEMLLAKDYLDRPSDYWLYSPGQRRVRRAPTYAHDNPQSYTDNLATVDQYAQFTGGIDRYNWKLVSKQELIVPYNNYKLIEKRKLKDVTLPKFINRDLVRYESHRVWKVEATVKDDARHIYPKRVFYIDEDTWTILVADMYDSQGKIWRVGETAMVNLYELPGCTAQGYWSYDLVAGRYMVDDFAQESPEAVWSVPVEKRTRPNAFTADELRYRGQR
jgi:hypothetical protein